jgi:hypothetical protein
MKSILFLLFSGLFALVSGFAFVGKSAPTFRFANTALEASKARDKVASRTKWLESRGYGRDGLAVAVVEAETVESETEASADNNEEVASEDDSAVAAE